MQFQGVTGTLLLIASTLVLLDSEASAQRRGGPHHSTSRSGYGHYYRPAVGFYSGNILWPWWDPFYGPWYYPPGYYLAEPGYPVIDVRLQVKPENAEVYVDGFYAGLVDDFDGFFQRLHLPQGEHQVQFYLDGYRTARKTLYLSPGTSYKIEYEMERLGPGEAAEPRPSAPERPERLPATTARGEGPAESVSAPARFGVLVLRVQPESAEILIYGEPWPAAEAAAEVVIHLAEGRHRVEVRKEGYQSFETSVDLTAEETNRLNIRLPRSAR